MKPKHILIIDDQPFIRHVLGMDLKRRGYHVTEAENGKTGVDAALQEPPDIILLDIMMPVMDGYEACRILRKNAATRDIPVIFLTANAQASALTKARESGANDFAVKSPDTSVLLEKIKKHLC